MVKIVDDFIEQYKIEYDFYSNLSQLAYKQCEKELYSRGIKAITSFRAKKPDSLREKLISRDQKLNYKDITQIKKDVCDLAGVRIALYFPNERDAVDKMISEVFTINSKKMLPEEKQKPTIKKRFSGYWANHYRVELRKEENEKRYLNSIIEIQVASVLMHAWSEIEHDLVYKPNNGTLSSEEYEILDEINGLVLVGEIALERLQNSMSERINRDKKFDNNYELRSYLSNHIENNDMNKIENLNLINSIIIDTKYKNRTKFNKILNNIKIYDDETVDDEIIRKILIDAFNSDKKVDNYIKTIERKNQGADISGFEYFLKLWILFEKITEFTNEKLNPDAHSMRYRFDNYLKLDIINEEDLKILGIFRKTRNELLHGVNTYNNENLFNSGDTLKKILNKIIDSIKDKSIKNKFVDELNGIDK